MDYALIALVALLVSGLTLFSGFGLGTLLMPAFALFFPVPTAIAATAVVHLANNLFKLALLGRQAEWHAFVYFGLPAAFAALVGASLLVAVAGLPALFSYEILGRSFAVTPVKLVIGLLIVTFALLELSRRFARVSFRRELLPLGGLLSGFFGGLSGNQGAFRSAFLIRAGLDKAAFVATGVVCAVLVDLVRLGVYGLSQLTSGFEAVPAEAAGPVLTATLAAFAGAYVGNRLLTKITLRGVQLIVGGGMLVVGLGLTCGWL